MKKNWVRMEYILGSSEKLSWKWAAHVVDENPILFLKMRFIGNWRLYSRLSSYSFLASRLGGFQNRSSAFYWMVGSFSLAWISSSYWSLLCPLLSVCRRRNDLIVLLFRSCCCTQCTMHVFPLFRIIYIILFNPTTHLLRTALGQA